MVKHFVMWKLRDDLSPKEKESVCKGIKEGLEGLQGSIPGLLSAVVYVCQSAGSTADVMLESAFTNEEALANYSVNSLHVEVANKFVRPFVKERLALNTVSDT